MLAQVAQGLQLAVEQDSVNNAVVKMRWCIDPATLNELKKRKAKNPHLLIIVWNNERRREVRTLVPLDRMMHYLQLRYPGENAILATIVWNESGKYGELWEAVFSRSSFGYGWVFVTRQGGRAFFREHFDTHYHLDATSHALARAEVKVVVEKEFFAKEPPAWLKAWVNFWFEGQPRDECHFRKRAIVAFTIQPLVVVPYYLIKSAVCFLVALFFVSLTARKINFRPIIEPWQHNPRDVYEDSLDEDPVFFRLLLWPLVPLLLLAESGMIWFVYGVIQKKLAAMPMLALLKWLGIVVAGEYGLMFLVLLLIFAAKAFDRWVIEKLAERLVKRVTAPQKQPAAKKPRPARPNRAMVRQQRWLAEFETRYTPLVCNGDLTPSLNALPKERQSLTLKFLDLKARVCKPFAG